MHAHQHIPGVDYLHQGRSCQDGLLNLESSTAYRCMNKDAISCKTVHLTFPAPRSKSSQLCHRQKQRRYILVNLPTFSSSSKTTCLSAVVNRTHSACNSKDLVVKMVRNEAQRISPSATYSKSQIATDPSSAPPTISFRPVRRSFAKQRCTIDPFNGKSDRFPSFALILEASSRVS